MVQIRYPAPTYINSSPSILYSEEVQKNPNTTLARNALPSMKSVYIFHGNKVKSINQSNAETMKDFIESNLSSEVLTKKKLFGMNSSEETEKQFGLFAELKQSKEKDNTCKKEDTRKNTEGRGNKGKKGKVDLFESLFSKPGSVDFYVSSFIKGFQEMTRDIKSVKEKTIEYDCIQISNTDLVLKEKKEDFKDKNFSCVRSNISNTNTNINKNVNNSNK
mmetsp:Transcript_325/g.312  ORF Transcript_325/g.312 Transcript_325/m.312 type:complete len:219 (-) Transcript_325:58-714(-)